LAAERNDLRDRPALTPSRRAARRHLPIPTQRARGGDGTPCLAAAPGPGTCRRSLLRVGQTPADCGRLAQTRGTERQVRIEVRLLRPRSA
jgi:hypothetical protein